MSKNATCQVVVLFEDEIRAAAKALHALYKADRAGLPDSVYDRLVRDALQTCFAAVYHTGLVGNEKAHVTVASKRMFELQEES